MGLLRAILLGRQVDANRCHMRLVPQVVPPHESVEIDRRSNAHECREVPDFADSAQMAADASSDFVRVLQRGGRHVVALARHRVMAGRALRMDRRLPTLILLPPQTEMPPACTADFHVGSYIELRSK